jgi:hypothetical protein
MRIRINPNRRGSECVRRTPDAFAATVQHVSIDRRRHVFVTRQFLSRKIGYQIAELLETHVNEGKNFSCWLAEEVRAELDRCNQSPRSPEQSRGTCPPIAVLRHGTYAKNWETRAKER